MRAITVLISISAVLGCADEAVASLGPLAVIRTDFGMEARNEGMLVVTGECVFLERDGERTLLLWPADQTSWSAETDEIRFRRLSGDVIKMRDGQPIVLGGGAFDMTVDGPNGEKVPREVDWVAEPDAACAAEPRWLVSDVEPT